MLKRTMLLILPAIVACNAQANTVEFCPNPKEIVNTNGVLTVKTESGEGEWFGILPNPARKVTTFDSAIFFSNEKKVDSVGWLRSCAYNTSTGNPQSENQVVDLFYRPEVKPYVPVKLAYPPVWEKSEGELVYFVCRSQDLQGCAFREAK